MINGPLLRRTWRAHGARVGLIAIALGIWASLMPVMYATFGREMEALIESGIIPEAMLRLMGGGVFGLDASIALGTGHPFAIALQVVYPVGFAAASIAGERQRGTLEVLLSRPLSRRSVFVTLLVAILAIALITTGATVVGTLVGAAAYGLVGELDLAQHAFLVLNTVLLLAALAGISLAIVLVGYVLEILGQLWPDAEFLGPYSPFHYLRPFDILRGREEVSDLAVLGAVFAASVAYGLWRFPRRDLAAPT